MCIRDRIDPYKVLIDTFNLLLGAKATVSMDATECKQKIAAAYKARNLTIDIIGYVVYNIYDLTKRTLTASCRSWLGVTAS